MAELNFSILKQFILSFFHVLQFILSFLQSQSHGVTYCFFGKKRDLQIKLKDIFRKQIFIIKILISFFYVLTCITSFQYLSIPCNAFIACYNYVTRYLIGINQGIKRRFSIRSRDSGTFALFKITSFVVGNFIH